VNGIAVSRQRISPLKNICAEWPLVKIHGSGPGIVSFSEIWTWSPVHKKLPSPRSETPRPYFALFSHRFLKIGTNIGPDLALHKFSNHEKDFLSLEVKKMAPDW